MGNPKQKWTSEEEEALRAGVAKHGAGKWKNIQKDPEFNHLLFARSNIDLKDKWRNLSVASGLVQKDKSKALKAKSDVPATPLPVVQTSATLTPSSQDASVDMVMLDSSRPAPEGNNAAKYNEMIYEALSTPLEPNGSDCSTIASYIERRMLVPANFRRLLSSRLRRLVQQDKLEKVQNCYKIKTDALPSDNRNLAGRPNYVVGPTLVHSTGHSGESIDEASVSAAYRIADAENKSFVAAEAVKEAERVSNMAEEMECLLQFASYCFDQSAHGDIILMA
ncbi:Telomere repeat-binding factor 5 [Striga hermonthica]|uniref:MYB transcription factor n=1 Tax=Striga hermonthica TaxID=68872 RepID=A0A9N7NT56_STRHE|nr:Telomere repeat-binding factor 5 [Striga hermonthica]